MGYLMPEFNSFVNVLLEVKNRNKSDDIEKKSKNKVIQKEEINVKES